jgi:phage terminase Nu1 subunit (DNA packaging protein)
MAKKKRYIHLLSKLQSNKSLSKSELKELEQYEKSDSAPGVVHTQDDIAKAFDVTERTVRRWIRDGMPVAQDGSYSLLDIKEWRERRSKKGSKKTKPEDADQPNWESRFRRAKALKAELDYKRAHGELISVEEVEAGRVERILVVKKALLGFPKQVAPQLAGLGPREIQTILDQRIREVIAKFSGQPYEEKKSNNKKR